MANTIASLGFLYATQAEFVEPCCCPRFYSATKSGVIVWSIEAIPHGGHPPRIASSASSPATCAHSLTTILLSPGARRKDTSNEVQRLDRSWPCGAQSNSSRLGWQCSQLQYDLGSSLRENDMHTITQIRLGSWTRSSADGSRLVEPILHLYCTNFQFTS